MMTNNVLTASLWMTGTLLSFCLVAIGARELSDGVSVVQMMLVRSVIGLGLICFVIMLSGKRDLFRTQKLQLHMVRNVFHFAGQYGWLVGVGLLPLAEVFALEFTAPFWTAILAAFVLKERLTRQKIMAILMGFVGVLVIVQPGIEIVNPASLIVLAAAMTYAVPYVTTKKLAPTDSPVTIIFYMCAIQLPIGLVLCLGQWIWPSQEQWVWLTMIGVAAMTAHYCLAQAMRYAETTWVVIMDFLRLPMIAVVGVILYGEYLESSLVIGAFIIIVGNILAAWSTRRREAS